MAAGYWRKPDATRATFKARLAGSVGAEGPDFLRTGDLGAIVGGDLYVLGRIKEMVIVRGRNHYAADLERTASESHAALGADRMIAFALEDEGEERLVLLHELTRAAMRDLDAPALFQAIRSAVVTNHKIDPSAIVPDGHSANRSLSAIEPVSATAKRKLENGEQRPAPEPAP